MAEEHIWNLIAKKLSGEASQAELQELEKLLRDNPDLHYPVQTIIDLWLADSHFNQQEAHEAFNRHLQRLKDLNIDFDQKDQQESDVILMPSEKKISSPGDSGRTGYRRFICRDPSHGFPGTCSR